MWKPSSVVPQHRTRAILVWIAILVTAFAYTVWQTTVVVRKRQNPSTKLVVSNQRYQFPLVSVCLSHSYGCGYLNLGTTDCIASALWDSHATYGGDDSLRIGASQGQDENCVEFDLTQVQVPEGEREAATDVTVSIWMDWVSSDDASAESDYNAGVYVTLGDDGSSSGSSFENESILVPYSRNVIASDDRSYETTALVIGKTTRDYLSGNSITNYPVLTLSSTRFVTTPAWDLFTASSEGSSDSPYSSYGWYTVSNASAVGSLFLEITQGSYSLTQVEDIEPLEIGALFGNIGGFWELLVLAWGVFFITKSRDTEPTLKARNFAKVLQRGGSNKRKRRELDSAAAAEASGHDGPRPQDWDSASDDDRNDSGASDSGAIEKGERSGRHRTHRSARPRRPVAHPLPRRVSFNSEPGSLGTSMTARGNLVPSRRGSASVAEGTESATPSTESSRRWSGSNAAIAASKFNTYDAGMAQTQKAVFAVNRSRSGSFSSNPRDPRNGGDNSSTARTSFFPTPQASASRIHPDSEDESSFSAGEEADENDLEVGYAGELEGHHGEA